MVPGVFRPLYALYGDDALFGALKHIFARPRRFAVTSNDTLVLVDAEAEVGDHICIIKTVSLPLVVRFKDGGALEDYASFERIDTAYVHGIMDGQAWEQGEKYHVRSFVFV